MRTLGRIVASAGVAGSLVFCSVASAAAPAPAPAAQSVNSQQMNPWVALTTLSASGGASLAAGAAVAPPHYDNGPPPPPGYGINGELLGFFVMFALIVITLASVGGDHHPNSPA